MATSQANACIPFGDCPWDQRVFIPFDIAADYLVDMSFHPDDIAGMLEEYEADHHTGMDVHAIQIYILGEVLQGEIADE